MNGDSLASGRRCGPPPRGEQPSGKARSRSMRVAVFDAWSGVAGDMWVGALLDAGVPMAPLVAAVRSLELPGVAIRAERVLRAGLSGTHFVVDIGGDANATT